MKAKELADKLMKNPDLEVLFEDSEGFTPVDDIRTDTIYFCDNLQDKKYFVINC